MLTAKTIPPTNVIFWKFFFYSGYKVIANERKMNETVSIEKVKPKLIKKIPKNLPIRAREIEKSFNNYNESTGSL